MRKVRRTKAERGNVEVVAEERLAGLGDAGKRLGVGMKIQGLAGSALAAGMVCRFFRRMLTRFFAAISRP